MYTDKYSISVEEEEKYAKHGKTILILDYLFIFYFSFKILMIDCIVNYTKDVNHTKKERLAKN